MNAAIAAAEAGDEIWVAGDAAHPYAENIALKDGVGLYGGFAGGETTRGQRDWNTNVTILDGGSRRVVAAFNVASATTVLDGFTVRNGDYGIYCTYSSSPSITNNIVAYNATGIYGSGGTPVLRNNCVFNPDGTNYDGLTAGSEESVRIRCFLTGQRGTCASFSTPRALTQAMTPGYHRG